MTSEIRMPLKLGVGLALATALDTGAQLFLKVAVSRVPATSSLWATAEALLNQPVFLAVIFIMVCQLINWLKVLDRADLSFAQPITSLSYVSVCVLSGLYLNERIDRLQILGIAIVLAGVWCISRTDRKNQPGGIASQ